MKKTIYGWVLAGLLIGLAALAEEKKPANCGDDTGPNGKTQTAVSGAADKATEFEARYGRTFQEISTLNLINGLNLTAEQIKQLIDCNKELAALRDDCTREFETISGEVFAAYGKLKEAVEKNQGTPRDVERNAAQMEQKLKQMHEEMTAEAATIEAKAEKILTEGQMEVLNTFNPCLIPPKNLKDPVRAGQANDNEQVLKMLQQIRSIPEEAFQKNKDKIVSRVLDEIQKHIGKLSDAEYEQEKQQLIATYEKVRAMDDVEFELNGGDIANEMIKHGRVLKGDDLRDEMQKINKTRHGGFGRVGMFLLKPEIIVPLLTKRLETMNNLPKTEPVDLDKVKSAPQGSGK